MPNPHVVNNNDGLSTLWLIAKHYQVSFEELKRRNLHIMNRYPAKHTRYGWLQIGDKVFLPTSQTGNRTVGTHSQRSTKNELIDDNSWRAFLFVLADEVLPSGKVVRKVLEFPGPSQAEYILAHPEIFGMKPPNPLSTISLGEHALGNNNSRFISASTKPGGAPNIKGRPVYIDIKKAQAAGVKIHSTAEIIADLDRLVKANPQLKPRVDKLKSIIGSVEGEVLLEGNVPRSAIKSQNGMMATRGLRFVQFVGIALTVYDVGKATVKSVEQQSAKPITAEAIRQIGGWGSAMAGAKAGAWIGGTLGIETGPGAILTGAAGALIFGTAGYFGADWIADFIDSN
jgi:hypothetical protein